MLLKAEMPRQGLNESPHAATRLNLLAEAWTERSHWKPTNLVFGKWGWNEGPFGAQKNSVTIKVDSTNKLNIKKVIKHYLFIFDISFVYCW